jgi:hypothetical protein
LLASLIVAGLGSAEAATYQTVNFSVTAERPDVAEKVARKAELYRRQLAVFWIGKPLPNWSRPCKISVREGALGAGGQTTFQFTRGEVLNWRMQVQGTLDRILDSVLPHEINHTIFACHFRRPLPRWADEGAATLFEHRSEQLKQLALLNEVIRNRNEMISLRDLLSMKEYPQGQRPMLTLYAQGYALADFLVQQKGRHAYLKFIADGERGGWEEAIRANYDHEGIESLEKNWRGWVLAGMPKLIEPSEQMLAATESKAESRPLEASRPEMPTRPSPTPVSNRRRRASDSAVVRSQSPDPQESSDLESEQSLMNKGNASTPNPSTSKSSPPSTSAEGDMLRRRTITAPTPRPKAAPPVAAGKEDASDLFEGSASFLDASQKPRVPAASSSGSSRSGLGAEPDMTNSTTPSLERTMLVAPNVSVESGRGNRHSSFDFGEPNLSSERQVSPGSRPPWAGFPGQKKSF